jgi:hypothetical protein
VVQLLADVSRPYSRFYPARSALAGEPNLCFLPADASTALNLFIMKNTTV